MLKRALFGEVKKFFLVWSVLGMVKKIFLVWSVLGKVKISRFFVKALRARYARYARSAPRPAFGRPWRALRWEKYNKNQEASSILGWILSCQSDLIFIGNLATVPEWSLGTVLSKRVHFKQR